MTENKAIRLSKAAREFNVGISTIVEFLHKKGHTIDPNPNSKIDGDLYSLLIKEYSSDLVEKKKSENFSLKNLRERKDSVSLDDVKEIAEPEEVEELLIKDRSSVTPKSEPKRPEKEVEEPIEEKKSSIDLKVVGKVDLDKVGRKKKVAEELKEPKEPKEPKVPEVPEAVAPKEEPVVETEAPEEKGAKVELPSEEILPETSPEPISESTDKKEKKAVDFKVVGKIDLSELSRKKKKKVEVKEETKVSSEKETSITKEETPISKEELSVSSLEIELTEEEPVKEIIPQQKKESDIRKEREEDMIPTKFHKLTGPTVVGRIDLPEKRTETKKKPIASSSGQPERGDSKRKRKRIRKDEPTAKLNIASDKKHVRPAQEDATQKKKKRKLHRPEVNEEDVAKQIKDTLAKLTSKGKSKGSRYRKEKRDTYQQRRQAEMDIEEQEKNIIKVTEFVSVSELARLMNVPVNEVIQTCMNLGLLVSINQRLDAETLALVADEFDHKVEFVSVELQDTFAEEEDLPEQLKPRSPIVTVMGHVDHGKTKLLDYIRNANVIAGEAGGITQHIGAYAVELENGRKITFLDTPGHEAFTAMRARGAQITDVAIIVVAADDGVMPQTVEAINHASAASVPIVFAINKIDKPTSNPEKIKETLASMNYLVEDWGGKYQSQEISAKDGTAIDDLLEKVLLEAELLELKANPERKAIGTVLESTLDKGRGYVATILVENGTLHIGDILLAGSYYGHIKAMYNERGNRIEEAGPATPVLILGLNGAPQAGDRFNILENDREAKEIANRREQLQREQELRTQKHITLDEIGRRIAIGNFKELNIIVKGDVDGSVEALTDSLEKLSTEEIQVNIIHKAVGGISESDILLAAASNAVVIGFQVRPSITARKIAEKEQIDIRLYSIIYDAIEELKAAMEGMLSPEIREEITATLEVLEAFKVTKVGTVAGCIVREGKINRNSKIRVIRDGIVVYTGELGSLKRFKDDAKEVVSGLECGLNIRNFNDVKQGDFIEAFSETEVKKKL